ncbi:hypothetical protein HGG75_05055 [Ochrobactrum pseudogrignonense]|nr:hypothetical protein [Brucella pseudogrignonensis]
MNVLYDRLDAADITAAAQVLSSFGEWPEDWQVILGGIADGSGFSAAEIDLMDAATATFWWNSIMAFRNRIKEAEG